MSSEARSSEPAIAVIGVGKCYHIYDRPQDRLRQALWRGKRFYREFWALREVSFDVARGEAIGIIGRNGSGKSTLLQIIAGTVTPTEGRVQVNGRISALLELGSGFNPEFTGRENIFMNAAILGIPRRVMDERFDDIAAFADIGGFLEQPVKTYSSGMHARLAFAVAFSIEPDILIVDEILAVGDVGFQQKCMGQLRRLRENGMTLLFVSHSSDAVRSVCQRALFLDHGRAMFLGPAERTVDQYLSHVREQMNQLMLEQQDDLRRSAPSAASAAGQPRYGTGHARIESVQLLDETGAPRRAFRFGEPIVIAAVVRAHIDLQNLSVSFLVRDQTGVDLLGTTTFDESLRLPPVKGAQALTVRFSFQNRLRPGNFGVCMAVNRVSQPDYSDNVLFDQIDACASFSVIGDPDRPVHYKFHQDVSVTWESNGHANG